MSVWKREQVPRNAVSHTGRSIMARYLVCGGVWSDDLYGNCDGLDGLSCQVLLFCSHLCKVSWDLCLLPG